MAERRYRALLFANWEFPQDPAELQTLHGPPTDVTLLREALTDPDLGLHLPTEVDVMENANRAEMHMRLEDFLMSGRGDEQLLVYYSGHGKRTLAMDLRFCARDTDTKRLSATSLSAREVDQLLESSPAGAKVLILDCCFAGSFRTKGRQDLSDSFPGRGFGLLAGTQRGTPAPDADLPGEPSPFTRYLVEALRGGAADSDGDGFVSFDDVYNYVFERTRGPVRPSRDFQGTGVLKLARSRARPGGATGRAESAAPRGAALNVQAAATLVLESLRHERAGQHWAAREPLRRVADGEPGDWGALAALRLAALSLADDDQQAATDALSRVVAAGHPQWSPEAGYRLGLCLSRVGDEPGAERALRTALGYDHPHWSPLAAWALAGMLRGRGNVEAALRCYRQAVSSPGPPAVAAALEFGDFLVQEGNLQVARSVYRRAALAGDPDLSHVAVQRLRALLSRLGCHTAAAGVPNTEAGTR
ncbi:caspase family protein [Catellatospora sp. NPDC049111]|uniref:caspase, EACC1-associated type n=1 Tax=Catellatospora sp. NPDC049111 TaxID=3155271 RepID=UPI0033C3299E